MPMMRKGEEEGVPLLGIFLFFIIFFLSCIVDLFIYANLKYGRLWAGSKRISLLIFLWYVKHGLSFEIKASFRVLIIRQI